MKILIILICIIAIARVFFRINLVAWFIRLFFRAVFGVPMRDADRKHTKKQPSKTATTQPPTKRRKIFAKEEGEYVDYEEVNEN